MILRDYTESDLDVVARRMRPVTSNGFAETHKMTPEEGVKFCVGRSKFIWTMVDDAGEIAALTGGNLVTHPDYVGSGFCWLIATDLADRKPREFMKASRDIIIRMYEENDWPKMVTFVDSHHPQSKKWLLKWLMFEEVKVWDSFGYAEDRPFTEVVHKREYLSKYQHSPKKR